MTMSESAHLQADDNQKKAIIDVINLLKKTFEIKDDDAVVINEKLTDRERSIIERQQELQRKEREFKQSALTKVQQAKLLQTDVNRRQQEIEKQVSDLKSKVDALNSQERSIIQRAESVRSKEQELKAKEDQLIVELERVAAMSRKDAVSLLCSKIETDAKLMAERRVNEIIEEATQTAQAEAQRILSYAIQKESNDSITELATSSVDLPSDALKGKIIGREGRNIKAFEDLTGVTVLIDDTPEMVVLSCYDPIRREIARVAMTKLIADGRIHPQRIEEIVAQCTEEFENELVDTGRTVATELHIADIDVRILKTLGKLKFRTSYSQNVLQHSKEVALVAADIAAEVSFDSTLLLRVGLLHDIGKALDRNTQGPHAALGAEYLRQMGESELVCKLVAEHHDNEPSSVLTWVIKTADTISSARPGARLDAVEAYVKRLQELEKVALSFEGIKTSYAILAGRELRVIVEPEKVKDENAAALAEQIRDKIVKTMSYPGQIRVVVVRETRHVQVA
jgi:ribonuclease Y